MKRCLLLILGFFVMSSSVFAQDFLFDSFDEVPDSNRYALDFINVDGSDSLTSRIDLSKETTLFNEGSAALRVDWRTTSAQSWGGFTKFQIFHPDSNGVWDLSPYNNLVLQYYNEVPQTNAGAVHLRVLLTDVSDAPLDTYDGNNAEMWYSFNYILDDAQGWTTLELPLEDVGSDAFNGSNGFFRTGWAGTTGNDKLDLTHIKGIHFEFSIAGGSADESGSIIFDGLGFSGSRAVDMIFFNGNIVPAELSPFSFTAEIAIEEGAGQTPGTNALRWTQDGNNPWNGFGYLFDPKNVSFRWDLDSLQFWVKAPTGTGDLRMVIASGDGGDNESVYIVTEPSAGYNDTWTYVQMPLTDFTDGATFNRAAVNKFVFMTNGASSGNTLYIDDLWTGSPVLDIIKPAAPSPPVVVTDTYSNLITWLDVPNEDGEVYNVYYSEDPITDVKAAGVRLVERGSSVPENSGSWNHLLYSPLTDASTNFYYAITAVDAAGNESDPGVTSAPISNTARGIATMSLDLVGANFTADGNLGEWTTAGVQPFELAPSLGSKINTNGTIDGDGDLSYKVYLAFDADYMYFAFDATDDVVDTTAANTYEKDSPDLFIGLYDQVGSQHNTYLRGDQPDYQLRFLPGKVLAESSGGAEVINVSSPDYHWGTKFPIGYVIEGRIALQDLADVAGDAKFVAKRGMRIPFDLSLNDADGGGVRQAIMAWSPYNDDSSWQSPSFWMYSWIKDNLTSIDLVDDAIPAKFELTQNYPNPFNPSTTISYSLPKTGEVVLDVYNALGQKVATLVNQNQTSGTYNVTFDASSLATGVYFYRLSSGSFTQVRKMLLMK